jgi:hypothetical protein
MLTTVYRQYPKCGGILWEEFGMLDIRLEGSGSWMRT